MCILCDEIAQPVGVDVEYGFLGNPDEAPKALLDDTPAPNAYVVKTANRILLEKAARKAGLSEDEIPKA